MAPRIGSSEAGPRATHNEHCRQCINEHPHEHLRSGQGVLCFVVLGCDCGHLALGAALFHISILALFFHFRLGHIDERPFRRS